MQVPEFDLGHWTGREGWSTTAPTPQGATHIRDPKDLKGLTEQDIWRDPAGPNIYKLPSTVPTETTPDEIGSDMGKGMPENDTYGGDVDALVSATAPTQEGLEELLKLQQQQLQSQEEFDKIRKREADAGEEYKTAGRDLQEEMWERFGMTENLEQLQSLMPQIASAQAEFDKMQEEIANQPISSRIIGGTQDRLKRQQSVEMAGLSAMAQAYQGNIDMARTLTQDAINVKYKDQEMYINNLRQQMNYISENLSREEQVKMNNLETIINERERNVTEAKELEMNISNIMLQAAQAGADQATLQKIMNSDSYTEAIMSAGDIIRQKEIVTDPSTGLDSVWNPNTMQFESLIGAKKVNTLTREEVDNVLLVMAKQEGYGADPNNIPTRHNNPLAIKVPAAGIEEARRRYNDPDARVGSSATDGGKFIHFSSADKGWEAGRTLLTGPYGYKDMSLDSALNRWSGGGYGANILGAISGDVGQTDFQRVRNFLSETKLTGDTLQSATREFVKENDLDLNISDVNTLLNEYEETEKEAKKKGVEIRDTAYDKLISYIVDNGYEEQFITAVKLGELSGRQLIAAGINVDKNDIILLTEEQQKEMLKRLEESGQADRRWYDPRGWLGL